MQISVKKYAELRSAFYQIDESKMKQIRDIFVNYFLVIFLNKN